MKGSARSEKISQSNLGGTVLQKAMEVMSWVKDLPLESLMSLGSCINSRTVVFWLLGSSK